MIVFEEHGFSGYQDDTVGDHLMADRSKAERREAREAHKQRRLELVTRHASECESKRSSRCVRCQRVMEAARTANAKHGEIFDAWKAGSTIRMLVKTR